MKFAIPFIALSFSFGCVSTSSEYNWGSYESSLYKYYKNPNTVDRYAKELMEIIDNDRKKVPPGIYAEYGYILLVRGNTTQAIDFFTKEKDTWPESTFLMNKVISNIQTKK